MHEELGVQAQAEILKLLNDLQFHARCRWEGGIQVETWCQTLTEFAVLFVLVESHDFCFIGVDQQAGALAPSLDKGDHSLKFGRVRGAKGKIVHMQVRAETWICIQM